MARTTARTHIDSGAGEIRRALQRIPNVGPAIADDLLRLGISDLGALAGQDADALYERLCHIDGVRHDPCMRDVLAAVVSYANGEPAQPWWVFSRRRKAREQAEAEGRV